MPKELTLEELYNIREQVYADARVDIDEPFEEEIELMKRITKQTMEKE